MRRLITFEETSFEMNSILPYSVVKEHFLSRKTSTKNETWRHRFSLTFFGKNLAAAKFFGGASRARTDDPRLAKAVLSQLSYGPEKFRPAKFSFLVHVFRSSGKSSPNEERITKNENLRQQILWAWVESNYRPHAYQACALTN